MIVLEAICHRFKQGQTTLHILDDICLEVAQGETIALTGPSGAGKSTLLHISGLLETPTSGKIVLDSIDASGLSDIEKTLLRRNKIGFVYQFHHLLPEFSAEENIIIPQLIRGKSRSQSQKRARDLLERLGLSERARHRPATLSGGEQQRVSIARALANEPNALLADEPTGNLDRTTASSVFEQVLAATRADRLTAIIATHNLDLAQRMDKVYELRNGRLLQIK